MENRFKIGDLVVCKDGHTYNNKSYSGMGHHPGKVFIIDRFTNYHVDDGIIAWESGETSGIYIRALELHQDNELHQAQLKIKNEIGL